MLANARATVQGTNKRSMLSLTPQSGLLESRAAPASRRKLLEDHMVDLPFQSAKQLAALIRRKKVGCLELLDLYLARVEKYNPRLNAIIAMDAEGARRRARAADRALAKGQVWGPLHGVPMT